MNSISLPIYSIDGKQLDEIKLNSSCFDNEINQAAMHQAVCAHRAGSRAGLASTKTMGEVRGGGAKPWKQKGTGRARVGSRRSPLWVGGGVIFGPHPRNFSYNLPQKIRKLALKSSLNCKIKENNLIIVDDLKMDSAKTKDAAKILNNLKLYPKNKKQRLNILLLLNKDTGHNLKAFNNLGFLSQKTAANVNAYDVLAHKKIIITKSALSEVSERLKER